MNGRDLLLSPELDKEKIAGFLAEFGFRDPEAADRGLQQIAGLSGDPFLFSGIVDSLLEAFRRSADPDSALRGMVSFAESLPSLTQFIQVAAENPSILEVACAITGGSEFLTLIMLRNPGYLYWLMEKGNLETCRDPEYFCREASRALRISSSPRSCLEALQRCQRREILRIGTQDLLHTLPMRDIAAQISRLADSMLQAVLELTAGEYGFPIRDFVVLGMGKLGGMELNFSSDVDLIFLHSDQVSRQETVRFPGLTGKP